MLLGLLAGPGAEAATAQTADPVAAGTTVVRTKDELLSALANATAGDTVFVDGSVSINLTGHKRILIPAGVTLASNRGQNGAAGALLYNTELDYRQSEAWAQFAVRGPQVRITGLRLGGPDQQIRNDAYEYDNSRGIEAVGASDLTVDNNELYGWSHGAVYVGYTIEARIRDNYIHHNRRTGLGYGVVLYNDSSAVIEDNTFVQNRHAIAGNGLRTQRYEARFNLVVDNARSHGFDMHGENETQDNGAQYAGDVIHIKHNSFRSSAEAAVAIRGRPYTGAWVSGNCFAHGGSSSAVVQRHFTGNLFIGSNTYGTTTTNCHNSGRRVAWRISSGGTASWSAMAPYTFDVSEVGFGDFDGDGRTDVFRATGSRWYYSPGGQGPWVAGASSGSRLSSLRFGDFNGDGRTDVFTVIDGRWHYSSAAATSWQPLAISSDPLASLRFGDFDGDGTTDVFRADGTRWYYSSAGRSSWTALNTSGFTVESLRFGDFNGDGMTDVFRTNGSQWYYSSGGTGSWTALATSSVPLEALRFADINGDGTTDVFRTDGTGWHYFATGHSSSWIALAQSSCPITSLHLADFNGDRKADVFDGRCGA
ncbi:FG-GAP-like repeat-containing protein [Allorhizocola rhizosphaerae]|uniref:FG-GAP-like repeat-containing protein n=1 Tax=Allorhizocola rhizosphaerae TaxID=1872709 RepID=UPI000E3E3095|nr:FG-GAP-like repeat-containing protein [Allorhizocola rhizosphaerae]